MIEFILKNLVTIVVVIILIAAVALAIRKIIIDRKRGIGPCGKRCSECSHGCDYSNKKAGS